MVYTLFLLPIGCLPYYFSSTGIVSLIVVMIAGVAFLFQTFVLIKRLDRKAALWMMFGSFFYLPIVQIAFVLDKNPW